VHLAQVNVARLRHAPDSPLVAEFVAAVDTINRLADRSPGFVWRPGGAHLGRDGDPRLVVNLSVWLTYEHLHAFVYRSAHAGFVRRRARWFAPVDAPATALWWVREGHEPTVEEALAHLRHLRTYGPSPRAFTVRARFTPGGEPVRSRPRGRPRTSA
jgi:hypothetical protein